MTVLRKTFVLESFKGWDHQVNLAVSDFKNKFGCFPNLMMANEVTFKRIDIFADKEKVLGEEGETVNPGEYVRLGGFGSEDYQMDFCLDDTLVDKAFVLIFDSDEEDEKSIPEVDGKVKSEIMGKEVLDAFNRENKKEFTPRFKDALIYSFDLHRRQRRKETDIPYFSHLMAVSSLVLDYGGHEDEAIAALLHDAIEDQGGDPTREEIRKKFGRVVAEIVEGCTDTDETPKPHWRERKEKYLAHLKESTASVRLVSSADKLHRRIKTEV